jgi:hypothetical protein
MLIRTNECRWATVEMINRPSFSKADEAAIKQVVNARRVQ